MRTTMCVSNTRRRTLTAKSDCRFLERLQCKSRRHKRSTQNTESLCGVAAKRSATTDVEPAIVHRTQSQALPAKKKKQAASNWMVQGFIHHTRPGVPRPARERTHSNKKLVLCVQNSTCRNRASLVTDMQEDHGGNDDIATHYRDTERLYHVTHLLSQ